MNLICSLHCASPPSCLRCFFFNIVGPLRTKSNPEPFVYAHGYVRDTGPPQTLKSNHDTDMTALWKILCSVRHFFLDYVVQLVLVYVHEK